MGGGGGGGGTEGDRVGERERGERGREAQQSLNAAVVEELLPLDYNSQRLPWTVAGAGWPTVNTVVPTPQTVPYGKVSLLAPGTGREVKDRTSFVLYS